MINVLGENYYIDLDEIEQYLDMSDETTTEPLTGTTEMRINIIKFEMVKLLLETVLSENEIMDDKLGIKSSSNTTVFGFTNHYWNGVTCLQFAKICEKIINTNGYWNGVKHIHSNTLNKKELVEMISSIYGLNVTVTSKETATMCDRSIVSIYERVDSMGIPTLETQIKEMKEFSEKLYSNDK